jgi:hypothetical protein
MSIAEQLIEEIKTLPQNRMIEVLDFVGYLKQREAERRKPTPGELAAADAALAAGEPCPLCAGYYDPETEDPPFNAETVAAIEEGRAMMRGEIPSKLYHSFEEMLADLDAGDENG